MQVTETLSDGLKRAYSVILPGADIETRRATRLAELGRTLRLPGFRPGKVPLPVVRQRYGSAVSAEVLEDAVNTATQQVLSERGLRPALQPKVSLKTEDVTATPATDLEFSVEIELLPEVALPDFSTIALTRLKAEVSPESVDKALAELAQRNRVFTPIENPGRGAEKGEVLTVDFEGSIDGTPFPGGAGTDMDIEVAGPGFIPGFTEQVEGLAPGESRTITVTFPEEYGAKELAGKEAQFKIDAKVLKKAETPAIDDALGQKLGFDGLAPVREAITQQMQREYDQMSRLRLKRELLDKLAETVHFPTPEGMVGPEFDQIWQRIEADRAAGRLDDEDKAKDEETLRSEYRAIAERRVRLGLLLAEIGRVNTLSVTAEELNRAMRSEAQRYPGQERQVLEFFQKNPDAAERLRGPIFEEKVVDFVLELAQITDRPATPEELAADPDAAPAA
ncbi:MAG: trigger factor [Rhodospirillales bacterium]|nr:trigger factor [Rhodospirillales bacterium]